MSETIVDPSAQSSPLLSVRDLHVRFPTQDKRQPLRAVDGVSFEIPAGSTLGLVGESGCGKTTTGRAVLRLIEPSSGRVTFDGTDILTARPRELFTLRRRMQIVFQDPGGSLNPRMRVGSIVAEPLEVHAIGDRASRRRKVGELLERVGLRAADAEKYPHEFSGGQRQRIGIARAVGLEPRFIVLDEPVSALDVSVQAQILNLLDDLRRDLGLTYLFIAHSLAVVARFSDQVAVMYLGRIVETGTSDEVFFQPGHPYTQTLIAAAPEMSARSGRAATVASGEPPSPLNPPSGCAFHPRCPHATEECRARIPELRVFQKTSHRLACHHAEQIAASNPTALALENSLASRGSSL